MLTLEQWDWHVRQHLHAISHHCQSIDWHIGRMTHRASFMTMTEAQLEEVDASLAQALAWTQRALRQYRELPPDE